MHITRNEVKIINAEIFLVDHMINKYLSFICLIAYFLRLSIGTSDKIETLRFESERVSLNKQMRSGF